MVWILQVCFDNEWIEIDRWLKELIEELKNYKPVGNTWEAVAWTDDLVSSLLMAVYTVYNRMKKWWQLSNSFIDVDINVLTSDQLIEYNRSRRLKLLEEQEEEKRFLQSRRYYWSHVW